MSTKVKGGKIKEGSIPLSALADDVKGNCNGKEGLNNYLGQLTDTNPLFIEGPRTFIYMLANNKIYRFGQTVYKVVLSGNGPNVTITGNQTSKGWTFTASANEVASYNVKFYADKVDVEIPTPDWNAQTGEAGYIENRICYDMFPIYNLDDVDKIDRLDYFGDSGHAFGLVYEDAICVFKDEIRSDNYVAKFGAYRTSLDSNAEKFGCKVEEREDGKYELIIPMYYIEGLPGWKVTYVEDNFVNPIASRYIPDTIIKTTPQELSNNDKNQALANLGIDPVVWKYICKPYIFNSRDFNMQMPIPSELMQNGKLKYKIPAMYRINLTNQCTDPNSGEEIDFPEINNQYGEYTPEAVYDNRITTAYLNNDYSLVINISATGTWNIQLSV